MDSSELAIVGRHEDGGFTDGSALGNNDGSIDGPQDGIQVGPSVFVLLRLALSESVGA